MKIVVQRVSEASVKINDKVKSSISQGLLILLGIENTDNDLDIKWLCTKISNLRIFDDDDGKMNLSIKEIKGNILLISQFTLHASTKKGNRPSFINAAKPEVAIPIYERFIKVLEVQIEETVQTGKFGAEMKVSLTNDGPVTIIIDSKNRI